MNELIRLITERGLEGLGRYYSIYRGIVTKNQDPEHKNRIEVAVPSVMGGVVVWALPRDQHGSIASGFKYLSPKVGDIVYITFEFGDPSKPLWEYHGWSNNQTPDILDGPNKMGFITPNGTRVYVDDDTGDLVVVSQGKSVVRAEGNIVLTSVKGKVFINSDTKVVVNHGENEGAVNIIELTEKMNNLVKEIEALKAHINTHTHSGVTTGPGISGPSPTPYTTPFSVFKKEDYEDTKFTH